MLATLVLPYFLCYFTKAKFTVKKMGFSPKSGSSTYYRLDFNNDTNSDQQLILQVDNPMINHLEVFSVVNNKVLSTELLGDASQSHLAEAVR